MKKGTGRTLLITMAISSIAAIIVFSAFIYLFDLNKMLSPDDGQTQTATVNGSSEHTFDDQGFAQWVRSTNDSLSALVTNVRTAGQNMEMESMAASCHQMETLVNTSLAELARFNLSERYQELADEYRGALNAFLNGSYHGVMVAQGSGMTEVRLTMSYFVQGSSNATDVMRKLDGMGST